MGVEEGAVSREKKRLTTTLGLNRVREKSQGQEGKEKRDSKKMSKHQKHTTAGIRWSSPTQLLLRPIAAYVGQIGRDAQLSTRYGRM